MRKLWGNWIEDLEVHCCGGMRTFPTRRRFSLEWDLGVRMVEKNYRGFRRVSVSGWWGFGFHCGRKQYLQKDCLWGFLFPVRPCNRPSGTDNLCLLVSQPPAHTVTCALSIQAVPAAARFYPVILHIIPCSSSCTFWPHTGERKKKQEKVYCSNTVRNVRWR